MKPRKKERRQEEQSRKLMEEFPPNSAVASIAENSRGLVRYVRRGEEYFGWVPATILVALNPRTRKIKVLCQRSFAPAPEDLEERPEGVIRPNPRSLVVPNVPPAPI